MKNRASLNENSNEHPQPARLWIIMITHTCNILCSFYGCKKGNFQMKNCDFYIKWVVRGYILHRHVCMMRTSKGESRKKEHNVHHPHQSHLSVFPAVSLMIKENFFIQLILIAVYLHICLLNLIVNTDYMF